MKIGMFSGSLIPFKSQDPLAKKPGYGWGWLILFGIMAPAIQRVLPIAGKPDVFESIQLALVWGIPIISVWIYFLIRKRLIERNPLYKTYWTESFLAGFIAYIIGAVIFFFVGLGLRLVGLF